MNNLPISVEKYLTGEAGFSGSEMMALRHLLNGEALTLRELAAKTGKSTGVLDKAVKKLVTKNILRRQFVNDTPKIHLSSPEFIRQWMKKDIQNKKQILSRKEEDIESFVNSIKLRIARPRIEYFEGDEGMDKAYKKLLDLAEKELFSYMPIAHKEEENPQMVLHEKHAQERKRRKIFLRVLSSDSPLGRRFKSRDHFELRKTVLVSSASYPIEFEKLIAGDTVACLNYGENRACFIRYPDLAFAEKKLFEAAEKKSENRININKEKRENVVHQKINFLLWFKSFFSRKKGLAGLTFCFFLIVIFTQVFGG